MREGSQVTDFWASRMVVGRVLMMLLRLVRYVYALSAHKTVAGIPPFFDQGTKMRKHSAIAAEAE